MPKEIIFVFEQNSFSLNFLKTAVKIARQDKKLKFWIIVSPVWLDSFQNMVGKQKLSRQIRFIPMEARKVWPWLRDLSMPAPKNKIQLLKMRRKKRNSNLRIQATLKLIKRQFPKKALPSRNLNIEGGDVFYFKKKTIVGKPMKNHIHIHKRVFHLDLSLCLLRTKNSKDLALLTDRKGRTPSKQWRKSEESLKMIGISKVVRIPTTKSEDLRTPYLNMLQIGNHILLPTYKGKNRVTAYLKKWGFIIHKINCDELSKFKGAIRCRTLDLKAD